MLLIIWNMTVAKDHHPRLGKLPLRVARIVFSLAQNMHNTNAAETHEYLTLDRQSHYDIIPLHVSLHRNHGSNRLQLREYGQYSIT